MLNKIIRWSTYLLVFLLPLFFLPFSFEYFELNKQYLLLFYFLITNNVGNRRESAITIRLLLKVFSWSVFFVILISYFSIFGVFEKINGLFNGKFSLPATMLQSSFNTITA